MATALRVLHVTRQFHPSIGGVERYVGNLCEALSQLGHHPRVLTLDRCFDDRGARLPPRETWRGIEVERIPFWGRRRLFVAPHVLLRARRCDVVHVHNVDSLSEMLAARRLLSRRPLVLTTHGGFFHTQKWKAAKRAYFATASRLSSRAYDAVVAVSDHDLSLFGRQYRTMTPIRGGVDCAAFGAGSRAPEPGRLVTVSRLVHSKRVDRLLEVVAIVARRRPDVRLVVIGPDPEGRLAGLRASAARLGVDGRVTFLGAVDDHTLRAELCRAHLFVSATQYEAFGIAVFEAMAAGLVPFVNAIEAFRGVVRPGTNGFVAEFSDTGGAAAALLGALAVDRDVLDAMSHRARDTASELAWPRVAAEHVALYRQLVDRRAPQSAQPYRPSM